MNPVFSGIESSEIYQYAADDIDEILFCEIMPSNTST